MNVRVGCFRGLDVDLEMIAGDVIAHRAVLIVRRSNQNLDRV